MALHDILSDLRRDPNFMANVMAWHTLPGQEPRYGDVPSQLHPLLTAALYRRGIDRLYRHQAEAVELALDGNNVAVVTPTASGKTLCYNLPILHDMLSDPLARALYLFPTKALAQDQLAELTAWQQGIAGVQRSTHDDRVALPGQDLDMDHRSTFNDFSISTYDGDTPSNRRGSIRRTARILLSNPDMLHVGILPYHPNWIEFLSGLRYVVIDEMHVYRGVFGSHMANVLRRLRRICAAYGSHPRFICTSATIANPGQLAEGLIEDTIHVIDDNGAPRGEKQMVLYNPPITDPERGLRRSSTLEAEALATRCILGGAQTIVFARSRLVAEVLLSYLQERLQDPKDKAQGPKGNESTLPEHAPIVDPRSSLRGYRGGYLPHERREIEAGLRNGQVRGVVATNALELGIDIGQLQAAVLCGYPGSIASTWQQMGRAGRSTETALAILVATGGVLDQYIIQHPEFLFEQSPEHAFVNPDNPMLLVDQLRCALFELPFQPDESFGKSSIAGDILQLLAEDGELQQAGGRFFWRGDGYPAQQVSLRSAGSDTVVIQAQQGESTRVIGEIDRASAPMLVHDGAIYMHEGQTYLVESLNLDENLAHVFPTSVDFYTEVSGETEIQVLAEHEKRQMAYLQVAHGDLCVSSRPTGFRRIKRFTHETLGIESLDYPPDEVETSGYWFSVLPDAQLMLAQSGLWYDSVNDYGPNWQVQRKKVRARDGYRCSQCGAPEESNREHDVHHLVPFRTFGYMAGLNENNRLANRLENLVLVCRNCHRRLESSVRTRTGLDGVAYAVANLAPLHLMCDRSDLGVSVDRGRPLKVTEESTLALEKATAELILPTVTVYERIVAGLGFSVRLFQIHDDLLAAALALIDGCACPSGCPACVGPVLENESTQLETKRLTHALLEVICSSKR